MKKAFLYLLFFTSIANGRAILEAETNTASDILYKVSLRGGVQSTKDRILATYGQEFGFKSLTDQIVEDTEGKKYLYVIMKDDGDCCFHSLGISRPEMLDRLEAYIRANEAGFRDVSQERLSSYEVISGYLDGYKEMIQNHDIHAFKGADFLDKEERMKKYATEYLKGEQEQLKELISETWRVLIEAQIKAKFSEKFDWNVILSQINDLLLAFQMANEDLIRVKSYKKFLEVCADTFWEEVSVYDKPFLTKIKNFMRLADHKTLKDDEGRPLKIMDALGDFIINDIGPYVDELNQYLNGQKAEKTKTGVSLKRTSTLKKKKPKGSKPVVKVPEKKPFKLSDNQIESINAHLQFTEASLENKIKILRRFYGPYEAKGRRVWLDPSAIVPIADQLNLKLKVYKLEENKMGRYTGKYYVVAFSPNANEKSGPELRRIYHLGGHYDMLVPLIPGL